MEKGTFRKIVALGTGVAMLGATVFGAMAAADLAQYPSPLFIKDGKFDGNIVVGAKAATEDVLGAIEIAASLQTAAVKKVAIPGAVQTASVDKENVKIRQTGREFTYNSTIRDVFGAPVDFSDLPTLLAEGTFDDSEGDNKEKENYRQELDFLSQVTGKLEFREADDVYNDAADSYLWFDDATSAFAYIYELDFDTAITYTNTSSTTAATDLENNVLSVQGNKYTITDVTQSGGRINKMELLAGETVIWMSQGEPLKRTIGGTEHTVILEDVNENEDKCGISVDGTTVWVDDGDTDVINGVQIGVTDAITVHSAGKDTDVCEVNVGATKITIEEDKEVKRDDQDVDGSNAEFRFANSGATAKWDGFNITLVPEDKVFLKAGDSWTDPVLENFQFDFAGMAKNTEMVKWSRSGGTGTLEFNNYDGKEVKVEWDMNESSNRVLLGKDEDQRLIREGDEINCGPTAPACEGMQLFVVTSGHEVHILEIDKVDTTNNKIDFQDVTYGTSYDDRDYTVGTTLTVEVGSLGTIGLDLSNGNVSGTDLVLSSGLAYTRYQSQIALNPGDVVGSNSSINVGNNITSFSTAAFRVSEDTEVLESGVTNNAVWHINGTVDATDDEIDWQTPVVIKASGISATSALNKDDDNDDDQLMASEWGSIAEWDADDNSGGTLTIPEDQAFGNAFISKVGAVVSSGSAASSIEFQQIQVGTAKLDTDISDVAAQNLLVVGGPCVNSVASTLMGNPTNCAEDFTEGEALIKLWEQSNGNVALLVAGYSALDTRRASKVVANYKDYADKLTGTEVVVKGTTLSDISISAVGDSMSVTA